MHHRLVWRGIVVEVRHTPNFLNLAHDHIEIEAIDPLRSPLPITKTGYRSHFIDPGDLEDYESVVAFAEFWLDQAAQSPEWQKDRQLWLF